MLQADGAADPGEPPLPRGVRVPKNGAAEPETVGGFLVGLNAQLRGMDALLNQILSEVQSSPRPPPLSEALVSDAPAPVLPLAAALTGAESCALGRDRPPPAVDLGWLWSSNITQAMSHLELVARQHAWPPPIEDEVTGTATRASNCQMLSGRGHVHSFELRHARAALFSDHGLRLAEKAMARVETAVQWIRSLEEPSRTGALASFVTGLMFKTSLSVMVILNCIFIAYRANADMANFRSVDNNHQSELTSIEYFFFAVFLSEVLLKLVVFRFFFFVNKDCRWNWLDLCLVAADTGQLVLLNAVSDVELLIDPTSLRALRLLKITRILRVMRTLTMFKELQLMVRSVADSCLAVLWAMCFLVFVLLILGIVFLQGLIIHCRISITADGDAFFLTEGFENIDKFFGSLLLSVLTLLQASTGGMDWRIPFDVLLDVHPIYAMLFVLYIVFFSFALINILTAIVVESINRAAAQNDENVMVELHEEHQDILKKMRNLFNSMDKDRSGTLSRREFHDQIHSELVQGYLAAVHVQSSDAEFFFQLLCDLHGEDGVPIDSFVDGCERMRGAATRVDIQGLSAQMHQIQRMQSHIQSRQHHDSRFIAVALSAALGGLAAGSADQTSARHEMHSADKSPRSVASSEVLHMNL